MPVERLTVTGGNIGVNLNGNHSVEVNARHRENVNAHDILKMGARTIWHATE